MVGLNVWVVVSKGSIGLPSIGRGLGFEIRTQVVQELEAYLGAADVVRDVLGDGDSEKDDLVFLVGGEEARISCAG